MVRVVCSWCIPCEGIQEHLRRLESDEVHPPAELRQVDGQHLVAHARSPVTVLRDLQEATRWLSGWQADAVAARIHAGTARARWRHVLRGAGASAGGNVAVLTRPSPVYALAAACDGRRTIKSRKGVFTPCFSRKTSFASEPPMSSPIRNSSPEWGIMYVSRNRSLSLARRSHACPARSQRRCIHQPATISTTRTAISMRSCCMACQPRSET